jgi:hypothetical protein
MSTIMGGLFGSLEKPLDVYEVKWWCAVVNRARIQSIEHFWILGVKAYGHNRNLWLDLSYQLEKGCPMIRAGPHKNQIRGDFLHQT